jgi:hypothetical protein
MEAKLAPFYRGLDDFEEDWTEEDIAKTLHEVQEQDFEDDVANSATTRLKEERETHKGVGSVTKKMIHRKSDAKRDEENHEREKRERRAYIGAVECPICFLVCSQLCTRLTSELPIKHQYVSMLPTTHLHRVLRADQTRRADNHTH